MHLPSIQSSVIHFQLAWALLDSGYWYVMWKLTYDLISYLFIWLACSSSATAMHMAMSAIKLGDIDQALIIGAVQLNVL